jgi:hypothetical protein
VEAEREREDMGRKNVGGGTIKKVNIIQIKKLAQN